MMLAEVAAEAGKSLSAVERASAKLVRRAGSTMLALKKAAFGSVDLRCHQGGRLDQMEEGLYYSGRPIQRGNVAGKDNS